jgi:antitoxin component YwqK of YwqJK toxin-antitoxin module
MKTRIPLRLLALLALLAIQLHAAANSGGTNTTDDNGLRQGYWVIKGYMVSDVNYSPEAVVEEGTFVDNRKEGLWKHYTPNGDLRSEINYTFNRPEGPYTLYYANGQVEEKGSWSRNRNTGAFTRYYENGQLQQEFQFSDNGKRNGVQKYYHENGQLELEVNIANGKEVCIDRFLAGFQMGKLGDRPRAKHPDI